MANLSQPASVNQIWENIPKNDEIVRKEKKGTVTKNPVDKIALLGKFRGEETAEIIPKDIARSARIHSVKVILSWLCRWHLLFREYLQAS